MVFSELNICKLKNDMTIQSIYVVILQNYLKKIGFIKNDIF